MKVNLVLALSAIASIAISFAIYRARYVDTNFDSLQPLQKVTISRSQLSRGDTATDKWLLVEFFNYQCPACRKRESDLDSFVIRNSGKLTLIRRYANFKHFNLSTSSSRTVELARLRNKYDEIHGLLMSGDVLTKQMLKVAQEKLGSGESPREKARIDEIIGKDSVARAQLRVDSIPTLYLISPHGDTYRVTSFEAAQSALNG